MTIQITKQEEYAIKQIHHNFTGVNLFHAVEHVKNGNWNALPSGTKDALKGLRPVHLIYVLITGDYILRESVETVFNSWYDEYKDSFSDETKDQVIKLQKRLHANGLFK